jgi:hypothetical protein
MIEKAERNLIRGSRYKWKDNIHFEKMWQEYMNWIKLSQEW